HTPHHTLIAAAPLQFNAHFTCNRATVKRPSFPTRRSSDLYSGDGLNNGAIDNGNNESVTTVKDTPQLVTKASETNGGVVGQAVLRHTATRPGCNHGPISYVTFSLEKPDNTTTTVGTRQVNG